MINLFDKLYNIAMDDRFALIMMGYAITITPIILAYGNYWLCLPNLFVICLGTLAWKKIGRETDAAKGKFL